MIRNTWEQKNHASHLNKRPRSLRWADRERQFYRRMKMLEMLAAGVSMRRVARTLPEVERCEFAAAHAAGARGHERVHARGRGPVGLDPFHRRLSTSPADVCRLRRPRPLKLRKGAPARLQFRPATRTGSLARCSICLPG